MSEQSNSIPSNFFSAEQNKEILKQKLFALKQLHDKYFSPKYDCIDFKLIDDDLIRDKSITFIPPITEQCKLQGVTEQSFDGNELRNYMEENASAMQQDLMNVLSSPLFTNSIHQPLMGEDNSELPR